MDGVILVVVMPLVVVRVTLEVQKGMPYFMVIDNKHVPTCIRQRLPEHADCEKYL